MSKYQTLVILADGLALHPRTVTIEGKEYQVSASAEGHSIAEMEPYESLVSDLANGQFSGIEDSEDEGVQTAAIQAQERAERQRENSYDE